VIKDLQLDISKGNVQLGLKEAHDTRIYDFKVYHSSAPEHHVYMWGCKDVDEKQDPSPEFWGGCTKPVKVTAHMPTCIGPRV